MQAGIVSVLALLYVVFPTVNKFYWLLSVITAQLALLVYIALFSAAIKLSYSKPDVKRHFRIPGKRKGLWTVCLSGGLSCLVVMLLGFLPPHQVPVGSVFIYELMLIGGVVISCLIPFLIYKKQ